MELTKEQRKRKAMKYRALLKKNAPLVYKSFAARKKGQVDKEG